MHLDSGARFVVRREAGSSNYSATRWERIQQRAIPGVFTAGERLMSGCGRLRAHLMRCHPTGVRRQDGDGLALRGGRLRGSRSYSHRTEACRLMRPFRLDHP
jgi:hypothetical protein